MELPRIIFSRFALSKLINLLYIVGEFSLNPANHNPENKHVLLNNWGAKRVLLKSSFIIKVSRFQLLKNSIRFFFYMPEA